MKKQQQKKQNDAELTIQKADWGKLKNGLFSQRIKASGYFISAPMVLLIGFGVPVGLLIHMATTQGIDQKWSVTCPAEQQTFCLNPFYQCNQFTGQWCPDAKLKAKVCLDDPGFCRTPQLQPGMTYGHTKGWVERNFFGITVGFLALAYGINHYVYNSKADRLSRKKGFKGA